MICQVGTFVFWRETEVIYFSAIFTVLSFSVDLAYIEFIVKMITPTREMWTMKPNSGMFYFCVFGR